MSTFIYNKYSRWYDSIILNALSQDRQKGDEYYESHHIVPKSLGGINDSWNLVLLTAKEHFIVHHLLTKFAAGKHKQKMHHAFWYMCNLNKTKITSTIYETARKQKSKIISETMSGKNCPAYGRVHTKEHKEYISSITKGRKNPAFIGYYHTPFGKLEGLKHIKDYTDIISPSTLKRYCRNCDKKITKHMLGLSKYLTEDMIGKSFRDIGFWFEPVT